MQLQDTKHQARKRLAIVARVSGEEQKEEGYSLDDQVDKGKALAALHGYSLDEQHIYSGQESGALTLAERLIISRVLADARAQRFDVVCFAKIDRMARKLKYMLELWDAFDHAGVAVHIIKESIDTATPVGRLMRSVLGAVAEFERDTILERTMDGRRKKLRNGELFLTKPMYGYTHLKQDKAQKIPSRVIINQEQAPYIRHMFEWRALGWSWDRIALELTAQGVPTRMDRGRWDHSTIRGIVRNPAYKGEGLYGRRRSAPTERSRRRVRWETDPSTLIPLKYPAIVTPELWAEAQQTNPGRHPVRASVDKYLLRGGMVRCVEHNLTMSGSQAQHTGGAYRCKLLLPDGHCRTHGVPSRALDAAVWDEVMAFLADPERGLAHARRLADETAAQLEDIDSQRAALKRKYEALDEEAATLLRLARRGTISEQRIDASMQEVEEQQARLRQEIAMLDAQQTIQRENLPRADRVLGVCRSLAHGAQYATPTERREILDMLHVRVHMDGFAYTITGAVPDMDLGGEVYRANRDDLLQAHRANLPQFDGRWSLG
jgi:site-specific DNA recombinase